MAEKPKKINIRLLVDQDVNGKNYKCNRVISLDAVEAKALVKNGLGDDSKASVEYALTQNSEVIDIEDDAPLEVDDGGDLDPSIDPAVNTGKGPAA